MFLDLLKGLCIYISISFLLLLIHALPYSIMLSFRWSPLVRKLPNPPGPLIILKLQCQKHQSQLVQSSLSCSIVVQFSSKVEVLILPFKFFQFYSMVSQDIKVDNFAISHFFCCCWLLLGLFWPRLDDPCVCQSPIGVYACHFLGHVLGCACTICSYGQI